MTNTIRPRIPLSDETGYNRQVFVKKRYVVVWDNCGNFDDRIFSLYIDAKNLFDQHTLENPRIEEAILFIHVKTVYPEKATGPSV